MPKLSVIMSVFNGEKYVKEAINSVLDQTFKDFEFIIINDGSTDHTHEILNSYNDNRMRIFHQKNQGLTKSLNTCINKAKTNLIARIDADDIAHPDRLLRQFNHIINNDKIGLLGTRAKVVNGGFIKITKKFNKDKIIQYLKIGNPFVHSSVIFRKNIFEKIGFYNEKYRTSQDFEAWSRLSKICELEILDDVLVTRRIFNNSLSTKNYLSQSINSFKIRRGKIPISKNVLLLCYQIISNAVPTELVKLIKNFR